MCLSTSELKTLALRSKKETKVVKQFHTSEGVLLLDWKEEQVQQLQHVIADSEYATCQAFVSLFS